MPSVRVLSIASKLFLVLSIPSAIAQTHSVGSSLCNSPVAANVVFDHSRVTFDRSGSSNFSFYPPGSVTSGYKSVRIVVTPDDPRMDPDAKLFVSYNNSCVLHADSHDFGGDLILVDATLLEKLDVERFWLQVYCAGQAHCSYHVALNIEQENTTQEVTFGVRKSGIAYPGVPLNYFVDCNDECVKLANSDPSQRITFSVWPRDATFKHHLTFLVRKDEEPSTKAGEFMEATRGWFSGQVVSAPAGGGRFHMTVLRRHSRTPLSFVLLVNMPKSIESMELAKPVFGAVRSLQSAFFKFRVERPNTDIRVYLTKLDGDPDISMSNCEVNNRPSFGSGQWYSGKVASDEILVKPDDPKRVMNPTGWFCVGVSALRASSFSLIALAETHVDMVQNSQTVIIRWTELWLGLPQTYGTSPRLPARFLFYNRLDVARLHISLRVMKGSSPDVCMATCGADPHNCPHISPFSVNTSTAVSSGLSDCRAVSRHGSAASSSDVEATVQSVCVNCWYSLLITNMEESKFEVTLGAEGRAHPLVVGEVFQGSVDLGGQELLLVFVLRPSIARRQAAMNSTLRVILMPLYGDPVFAVQQTAFDLPEPDDGVMLFNSSTRGTTNFDLHLLSGNKSAGVYYFKVWAVSQHAMFRLKLLWDTFEVVTQHNVETEKNESIEDVVSGFIDDGNSADGVNTNGLTDIFIFRPSTSGDADDIEFSCAAAGDLTCKLYIFVTEDDVNFLDNLKKMTRKPQEVAQWQTVLGEETLVVDSNDKNYAPPSSEGVIYAIGVARATANVARFEYVVYAASSSAVLEMYPGVPVYGVVTASRYRRYRIGVPESNRSVIVSLIMRSGDCDLFVGSDRMVSRAGNIFRSGAIGNDFIYVPALNDKTSSLCSTKVLDEVGECVYYVAVQGRTPKAEYELTASITGGRPVRLATALAAPVAIPPSARQDYYVALKFPMKPTTLMITSESGRIRSLFLKVTSIAHAAHPTVDLTEGLLTQSDVQSQYIAGVWSAHLDERTLAPLCSAIIDSECALFVSVRAEESEVFFGQAVLLLQDEPEESSEVNALISSKLGSVLEAGKPSRAEILNKTSVVTLYFRIPEGSKDDLVVSVMPLSDCTPTLRVNLPGTTSSLSYSADDYLRHIHAEISHTDHRYRPGIVKLLVGTATFAGTCHVDVRAELSASTDELDGRVGVAPEELLVGTSLVDSVDRTRFFLFTSRIPNANLSWSRAGLEVRVTELAGEIEASVAFLKADDQDMFRNEDSLLKASIGHMPACVRDSGHVATMVCLQPNNFESACEGSLVCQMVLRVNSVPRGQIADLLIIVSDDADGDADDEMLLLDIPKEGRARPARRMTYAVSLDNPSAKFSVRLTCKDDGDACKKDAILSADARPKHLISDNLDARGYVASGPVRNRILSLIIKPLGQPSSMEGNVAPSKQNAADGRCHTPCVLFIIVECRPGATEGFVFKLDVSSEEAYALLLDGDDPDEFVAARLQPEYFLFDSRHADTLLTISLDVPYDDSDPLNALVSMYILDCAEQGDNSAGDKPSFPVSPEQLRDTSLRPSPTSHRYRGKINPAGELVAHLVTRLSLGGQGHCYYRIAVISNRPDPTSLAIRGFEAREGTPLFLGRPLHGLVSKSHRFSYMIETDDDATKDVALSLEVCSGEIVLDTFPSLGNRAGANPRLVFHGGFSNAQVSLRENRGLVLSASGLGTYILSAEDPAKRVWLEPRTTSTQAWSDPLQLQVSSRNGGTSASLTWAPALLFGAGQTVSGSGGDLAPVAQYEVFYFPRRSHIAKNFSTPCGLYSLAETLDAMRIFTKFARSVDIGNLDSDRDYIFNVVARHHMTGHSMAYKPFFMDRGQSSTKGKSSSRLPPPKPSDMTNGQTNEMEPENVLVNSVLHNAMSLLSIAAIFFLVVFFRPCCGTGSAFQSANLELSSRRSLGDVSSRRGTYAPPSVVGCGLDD
eukprot:TRINITY_DN48159_c0_g1_i1.p1 TRINITY_DN48159_c0_g1~~TRINITY_DN48159_c0_g1_i1.p1  ORF type:complete len:2010 (+),score=202.49 TRINITY_DN48159_c0_g1_i1:179-6031(+)